MEVVHGSQPLRVFIRDTQIVLAGIRDERKTDLHDRGTYSLSARVMVDKGKPWELEPAFSDLTSRDYNRSQMCTSQETNFLQDNQSNTQGVGSKTASSTAEV